jgi:DNA polymerase-1
MLINLIRDHKPTHIAVAFDISRFSFRTREYPEYKGTRGETPSEFIGQVPLLQDCLAAMNITTISIEDYEADDILATLSVQGRAQGYRVLVVSGDRDTIQLVNDDVTLLYPSRMGVSDLTLYDAAKVMDRYGIQPHQYPEVAALVGETSDNLPGVPKVGEKTAVKWLNLYGSLDGILENADKIAGKVGESLREHKENAVRNRRLNHLLTDVELPVTVDSLEKKPIDEDAVRDIFARLEFRTMLDRLLKAEGIADDGDGSAPASTGGQAAPVPQTLLDEELRAWLDRAVAANPEGLGFVVDVHGGKPAAMGISTPTESIAVAWLPERADYAPFEDWLASPSPKLMTDSKRQLKALKTVGLRFDGLAYDTHVAGWLLRPSGQEKTLADLVSRYLDETLPVSDPNQLVPVNEPASAPVEAWYTVRLVDALNDALDLGSKNVLTSIEMPTLLTLVDIELRGVTVNHAQLTELSAELGAKAADLASRAYAIIGHEVNLGSPKQLQEVLFNELDMPKTRANKTGYSTDAGALADLQASNPHPFLGLLLEHRDATKLRQIVETVAKAITADGRVHTSYVQTGTTTGRISSTDPNLQNIPVRTEEGRRIRASFEAGSGYETLLTADYSQIEMRIMAHLSGDEGLIEAFRSGEDLHRFVGSRIFSVDPADVTNEMRTKVKAMSYGLAYGLSAFGLSKQLRIDSSEAKTLMSDYFARFGAVRDYLRNVVEQAVEDGYTTTIFGRRRPFPDLKSPNRVLRDNAQRAALNAPIQGSAADIMKIAMIHIEADAAAQDLRSRMLMQVHDELIFEVVEGEWDALEAILRTRMAGAADLLVPLEVQVGRGHNWDAAAH